jgi:aldose 1-epimerase
MNRMREPEKEWSPGGPRMAAARIRGIPALVLEAGGYRAAICPDMGANCFLLERGEASYLRQPPDYPTFRANPNVYGMPLLFPPNRIRGGTYLFQGRKYSLPVNEEARGHHIHGFLSSSAFDILESGLSQDSCSATFGFRATRDAPYSTFPHEFSVELEYGLGPGGLTQKLFVLNEGSSDMPLGLGFHTALNCPFLPGTGAEEYLLGLDVAEQILLDPETIIPTGAIAEDNALLSALRDGSLLPQGEPLSAHFRATSGRAKASPGTDAPDGVALRHGPSGRTLRYRVDPSFAFWTLWNGDGSAGFICPEPQTWTIDAPNSPLPSEASGFFALGPGGTLTLESTLSEV